MCHCMLTVDTRGSAVAKDLRDALPHAHCVLHSDGHSV